MPAVKYTTSTTLRSNRYFVGHALSGGIINKVLSSQPVMIIGFKALRQAGDPIVCVESEENAEQLIERRAGTEW
jgi:hypothetical protein